MPNKTKVLFIANLGHNQKSLYEMWTSKTKNITEIYGSVNMPLGLLSIQSYVNAKCIDVDTRIMDLNVAFIQKLRRDGLESGLNDCANHFDDFLLDELRREIKDYIPNMIAISTAFDKSISTLLTLCSIIKRALPDCTVIVGGHPTNNLYEYVLTQSAESIDAVSYGEGEIPFAELLSAKDMKGYLNESKYFITLQKLDTEFRPAYAYIENLDDIPLYDYESYFEKYGTEVLEYHNNVLDLKHSFNRQAVIMTSRGCPYNCVFCASREVHGKKMRANSVNRIKQEIDWWVDVMRVETIAFLDDHFLYDVERAIELCDYAGAKGLDIRFPNGLAIAPITQDLVRCMVRNHVKEVSLALESGSERVLREIICKPLTLEIANRVFGYFRDTDIFVKCFLVTGFPEETENDIEEGLNYLRQADFNWCTISNLTPISGSRVFADGMKKGTITDYDLDQVSFFKPTGALAEKYNGDLRYTMNLDINFVHNALMRMGRYKIAQSRFESILNSYPNHAFAWYYAAECMQKLDMEEASDAKKKYFEIVQQDEMWRQYAEYFGLPIEE